MAFFEGRGVRLGCLFLQTLIRILCFVWHHVGLVSQMSRPVDLGDYKFAVSVSILKDNISIVNFIDLRAIHTKNYILGVDGPHSKGCKVLMGLSLHPSHVRLKTIFLIYQITLQARTAFAKICPSLQYVCVCAKVLGYFMGYK